MRQIKSVEIDGKTYNLLPMSGRVAAPYEAKALKIMVPLLGALQNVAGVFALLPKSKAEDGTESVDWSKLGSLDLGMVLAALDMRDVTRAISEAIDALAPHELDYLISGCMSYVQTHVDGKGFCTLKTLELVDAAFDDTTTLYKVLFEVARFNKFRPFALFANGSGTPATVG